MLLIGFLAFGGVIAILPIVLLGKLKVLGILKVLAAFIFLIICSVGFYLVATDATLIEILALKANSTILPKRIFSVSYTMIIVLLVLLPIAALKTTIGGRSENA